MSELTLFLLQLAFLGLLWAFVFAIVYALRTDLLGLLAIDRRKMTNPLPSPPQTSHQRCLLLPPHPVA